ncbi:MAG: murein biosynthesis integral membrane protein MurJ [Actinobacteria bacterium]|nr:murein biosynthesis integral membrane protein MurJ [Actinomycetota bacterium]
MSGTRLGKAALIVSGGILLSRLLGFLRTMTLAGILGATRSADLFQDAFTIPDILFYLMAGGFLSITFIPILARHMAAGDEREGWRSFAAVFRPVAITMTALTVIAMIAARPIVSAVFPRFAAAELDELAHLMRIVFPAQIFFVLGSLFMAVQYAHKRFVIPILAPLVYNTMIIAGGLVAWKAGDTSAEGFIWGALVGAAIGNFGLQWYGAHRLGLRWERNVPWNHPALKEYLLMALPLMLGQSVAVLDEQFLKFFGQLAQAGSTGLLAYARRINMLPVGMIAQAAGVAAYPFLASLFTEGRIREFRRTVTSALRYGIFFGCAATAAVVGTALPTIRIAYQRGRFGPEDTLVTAGLLALYALSIPFWAIHQIYARAFYAQRRMWIPVGVGTAATAIAIPLYLWLFNNMNIRGLALASTLSIGIYAIALASIWYVRNGVEGLRPVLGTAWRSAVAGVVAGLSTWEIVRLIIGSSVPGADLSLTALAAGALVVVLVYGVVSRLLGTQELTDLLRGRTSRS